MSSNMWWATAVAVFLVLYWMTPIALCLGLVPLWQRHPSRMHDLARAALRRQARHWEISKIERGFVEVGVRVGRRLAQSIVFLLWPLWIGDTIRRISAYILEGDDDQLR